MTNEELIKRMLASVQVTDKIKGLIDKGEWHRAGGECICTICGHDYTTHSRLQEPYDWMTILCDDSLVKL